jgi:hypothetical protein
MAIGPSGPQSGIDATNAGMGLDRGATPNQQGGHEGAARERLMQIAAEAEAIVSQFPHLGQELLGGGGQTPAPVGPPGGMPEMPVAGNTGASMGGMPGLIA